MLCSKALIPISNDRNGGRVAAAAMRLHLDAALIWGDGLG